MYFWAFTQDCIDGRVLPVGQDGTPVRGMDVTTFHTMR